MDKQSYRKTSSISRTKSQNLNASHLVLQSSLPNQLKPNVKLKMKMYLEQRRQAMLQLHLSMNNILEFLRYIILQLGAILHSRKCIFLVNTFMVGHLNMTGLFFKIAGILHDSIWRMIIGIRRKYKSKYLNTLQMRHRLYRIFNSLPNGMILLCIV